MFRILRSESGQLSQERSYAGSALNPALGLVIVGSISPTTSTSDATTDGINIDATSVADFGDDVYGNCLVSVNETTLISIGGRNHDRKISILTIGNSAWEVK